jgi:hypothetical protein
MKIIIVRKRKERRGRKKITDLFPVLCEWNSVEWKYMAGKAIAARRQEIISLPDGPVVKKKIPSRLSRAIKHKKISDISHIISIILLRPMGLNSPMESEFRFSYFIHLPRASGNLQDLIE